MIESDTNGPQNSDVLPATDTTVASPKSGGGKATTVFGALFGAAAAVPT